MSDGSWTRAFEQGDASQTELLGGKGANLAEMSRIGLPVPPGFTITAPACNRYQETHELWDHLRAEIESRVQDLEAKVGQSFGAGDRPLLVSVRSGAAISMPGMMDTVLNLGLNDDSVEALAKATGNPRFAFDCYRRFLTMYADVVLGLNHDDFDHAFLSIKEAKGIEQDYDVPAEDLEALCLSYKTMIEEGSGAPFPQDPLQQLFGAVEAVFRSWENPRAVTYRRLNRIPDEMGTAVNIQTMVFGNLGEDCATGVAFTRDPSTGENVFYGEFLQNAQGEDVVAGIRTPEPIVNMQKILPAAHKQLVEISSKLEQHYGDMQDLEFTVQNGTLYMLQTRRGKRTGLAAVRIALEMLDEGLINEDQAVLRVDPDQLNQLLRPIFDPEEIRLAHDSGRLLARGLNAGPGAASGRVVFSADDAVEWKERGEAVILVRDETSPEDIHGMHASEGFLTARGGMTSHAALVARQMGKVCVAGCAAVVMKPDDRAVKIGERLLKEGDWLSLDGFTGDVLEGKLQTKPSEVLQVLEDGADAKDAPVFQQFDRLLKLADGRRKLLVRANADQADQAISAIALGAEGIGLCRTEHMFFGPGKIEPMREMILAASGEERRKALAKILPLQRADFEALFEAMAGRPVTIRLLDPPLHEFLPHGEHEQRLLAEEMDLSFNDLVARIDALAESNPMLGHRGCRLGITVPEITQMQAQAILEAATHVAKKGIEVLPEIMIPIVSHDTEFRHQEQIVRAVAKQVAADLGQGIDYLVGTMIELPRAALTADKIAQHAEFFSFGTNDLTQTTLGVSRDDAGGFLTHYQENKLIAHDPFQSIDEEGVGQLVRMGVDLGRGVKENLKVGICGEHGGDPQSVHFCHNIGLDYVSCSPYRIPIARLAAAHAALKEA